MNTVCKQFKEALKREGKTITTYYKSESVECLFRKNNDGNNTDEHITIFYDISAPINKGKLITYGGKNYLVMNKESVENDIYYKSSLLECNMLYPLALNSVTSYIPCYCNELSSTFSITNNVMTLADGKGEILTESTDDISSVHRIDDIVNILGWYYKVDSNYVLNGISHLFVERTVKPADNFLFDISSSATTFETSTNTTISSSTTNNGIEVQGQTVTYTSSNPDIATVTNAGVVTFLTVGSVSITGTWVEKSIFDTLVFTVTGASTPAYSYSTITCSGDLIVGGTLRTLTPTFYEGDGTLASGIIPVWTWVLITGYENQFTISYVGNQAKIKVAENYDLIEKTITANVMGSNGGYGGSITLTVGA